jgi:hypothetical protein
MGGDGESASVGAAVGLDEAAGMEDVTGASGAGILRIDVGTSGFGASLATNSSTCDLCSPQADSRTWE